MSTDAWIEEHWISVAVLPRPRRAPKLPALPVPHAPTCFRGNAALAAHAQSRDSARHPGDGLSARQDGRNLVDQQARKLTLPIRVATARRNHSIAGQKRALPDPERVSLSQAARICGVSHRTIERLVEAGLLKCEQVTPRAPWEIRRTDLDAEPIRRIIDRLHRTGKLILQGGCAEDQLALFIENAGDDNARHHE